MRADSSGSALTSATHPAGLQAQPADLVDERHVRLRRGRPCPASAPVAGTTCRTLTTLVAPMCARVAACSICVAFCTGQDRNAAKPYVETSWPGVMVPASAMWAPSQMSVTTNAPGSSTWRASSTDCVLATSTPRRRVSCDCAR